MKIWHKTTNWNFGQSLVTWRNRDNNKFYWKILSWLLGAFVFGILTSIAFGYVLGLPDIAKPAAQIMFVIVYIIGMTSQLFRCILYGFHYQITEKAIVHIHPFYGWEELGKILGSENKPFKQLLFYFEWNEIKEIRESGNGMTCILKKDDTEVFIPVIPVTKLSMTLSKSSPDSLKEPKNKKRGDKETLDKNALKTVLQAAREARKSTVQN